MKRHIFLLLILPALSACFSPQHYMDKGDYHSAVKAYGLVLADQPTNRKKKSDLEGLERAFNLAQQKDAAELVSLAAQNQEANWPRVNAIHRNIQERQNKLEQWQPLKSRKGFTPKFQLVSDINSLESDSRLAAAGYLYTRAQELLATGQPSPSREAHQLLSDLKKHYYPDWENSNSLLDSARTMGMEHLLFVAETRNDISDGGDFWSDMLRQPPKMKNEWIVIHTDTTARNTFDYLLTCRLESLMVGSENQYNTTMTETQQVEDGYEEIRDTSGKVISRTAKFRTETIVKTTHFSEREATASVFMELKDMRTGSLLISESIQTTHRYQESSEIMTPSAPTYWGMIGHLSTNMEWEIQRRLNKDLLVK
ncbi:MAG: hypothetical protein IT261_14210 [Saprospiraceae bacterium]|nr:hypothetical protein [Saprospiraceae bacterium]